MKPLILLYSDYSLPNEKSIVNQNIYNVIAELKKLVPVKVFCLLYRPDQQKHLNSINGVTILDIHQYSNAVEIIERIKPNVIFGGGTPSAFISSALQIAGKFKSIPVVNVMDFQISRKKEFFEVSNVLTSFFSNNVPTDKSDSSGRFMKRGLFFLFRLKFLLKTQIESKSSLHFKLHLLYIIFSSLLSKQTILSHPIVSPDYGFLVGKISLDRLINLGFNSSSLIVTGLPAYDSVFSISKSEKTYSKIENVLFVPETLFEHRIWSKTKQFSLIRNILFNLSQISPALTISVKIHPSYSNYSDYNSVINEINPSIQLYQKEDFLTLLTQTDLVISFSSISSASIHALLSKKPIIICNPEPLDGDLFLEKKMAEYCKNPEQLGETIKQIPSFSINEDVIEEFVKDFLFAVDGKASYRICEEIIKICQK